MTAWIHALKGKIVGTVVGQDDTWVHILLLADAWADARHRRLHDSGTVQTYRRSFLVEVIDDSADSGTAAGPVGSGEEARASDHESRTAGRQLGSEHQPSSPARQHL